MRSLVLSAALCCLAWSATARGEEDATEKARARFFQGVELYKEGSFEAALAEFRQAYQMSPSYRVLYNIAQTHFELHDYANAFLTLKDYVERGGDEISAARRVQVDELNHKLEKRIAYIDIACNVDGADLRVDDLSVGRSPLTAPVLVNAGPRKISATKGGHTIVAHIVTVAGGDQAKVAMEIPTPTDSTTIAKLDPTTEAVPIPSASLQSEAPRRSAHSSLVASIAVAGGCAVVAGVFGWLLLDAKDDFDTEVAKRPYDRPRAESLRTTALTYEYLADAFAGAALISGGIAVYFAVRGDGGKAQAKPAKQSMAVVPTLGGVLVRGTW
jgi:hypothetical protein